MTLVHTPVDRPVATAARMDAPSAAEVRAALARLLEQPPLKRSRQLTAFLTYVVETTLAGRAATIKAYTIACDALGRGDDFDPQADPIVRVEAGRLRRILDGYYQGVGANDPVRIELPRGRYIPIFIAREVPRPRPRHWIASPNLVAIAMGIVAGLGGGYGLMFGKIGTMERTTLIAALLMSLHVLIGGGFKRRIAPSPTAAPVRVTVPAGRIAASGAPRR